MSDPRNVAHDKKVIQEKKHHHEGPAVGAVKKVQPGKKPELQHHNEHEDPATERAEAIAHEAEVVEEAVAAHDERTAPHKPE
ncbi:MAG: hypothetical protein ABJF10_29910 [Chthoniobacter sp.]|uniref:hypothetical protein n=1 Tax=Chthoniobacter sp. TaxID=2510640 RepID=UPI0032A93BBC